ncbi:MAG: DUF3604 domain-containing protein, partial [Deltaproteobacteria bacterium]|nr:DUF3604 domain-containing protein [Deltaproteobacteria bacterium]
RKLLIALIVLVLALLAVVYAAGVGLFGETQHAGSPSAPPVSSSFVAEKEMAVREAALDVGIARPKQILFGDLHVHSTFSFDAFTLSLPMTGGDGAHPVSDACDFARHCAALDFWSINDHAVTLTPRRWSETIDAIRQCNDIAGNEKSPDLVSYLGWEWTQVGMTPGDHYGHKNVVIRGLDDLEIPTRPIAAGLPLGIDSTDLVGVSPFLLGLYALSDPEGGTLDFAAYQYELGEASDCPTGVPVRDLPSDCRESARTPGELFEKLDDWGFDSMVIPHGTTWGFYTPLGSAWDKQLTLEDHDPERQRLIEVFSGHGNSEEFRPFEEVRFAEDGTPSCPEPAHGFLPTCWRAGEIIEERCLAEGEDAEECGERAALARQLSVEAERNGGTHVVPATEVADWQDAGQCRDCFQPSFNYRPKSSVQYIMALGREDGQGGPFRFDFGFIAASDNHSARPGTGYKEVARTEFTEQRFGSFVETELGSRDRPEYASEPVPYEYDLKRSRPLSAFEIERGSSFFLNGGLAAVHASDRDRDSIWNAMHRKEVYGTSGPRILLWFDLLNAPGRVPAPMGSQLELSENPIFQVKAVGSFEQLPGCGEDATSALEPERIERLCQGECYNPSPERRVISRLEVVRIRPQRAPDEQIVGLVEDPWKVIDCPPDPEGCVAAFVDGDYVASGRDALYYVRAIEEPSLAVAADPLGCRRDESGRCVQVDPCFGRPDDDECLAQTEERAWSSPIFVNQNRRRAAR